jgi:hypothetical protein
MIRNGDAAVRIRILPENNVTASLSIVFIPDPSQSFDNFPARDAG